jgi:hypothetical protein
LINVEQNSTSLAEINMEQSEIPIAGMNKCEVKENVTCEHESM